MPDPPVRHSRGAWILTSGPKVKTFFKKFWGQPSATNKKGLYGYVADSSPPPNSHPHPIVRAPDERACLRARGSPGAGPLKPQSTGAAEARRRAEGVGHSMAASSAQSGAAPWCRTIAKLCAVQTTVCHESEVLRHPCGPAIRRRQPAALAGGRESRGTGVGRYLVDPASSHMLVSRIKPCMSKYKHLYRETANGSLKQLWFIWWFLCYLDNRSNSRANTCTRGRLREPRAY